MGKRENIGIGPGRTSKHHLPGKTLHSDRERQEDWRRKLKVPTRHIRLSYLEPLPELLAKSWPPEIFLRENAETSEIVVRFRCSSRMCDPLPRIAHQSLGVGFSDVFSSIVRTALRRKEDTFKEQLASLGYDVYQKTWMHFLWLLLRDQFSPELDDKLDRWLGGMDKATRRRGKPGRPSTKHILQREVRKTYRLRLAECEWLHGAIQDIVSRAEKQGEKPDSIRASVLRSVWKKVYGLRLGNLILGGEVFDVIPNGKQVIDPKLRDPRSWKPRQMAIARTALELDLAYETVVRHLRAGNTVSRTSQQRTP